MCGLLLLTAGSLKTRDDGYNGSALLAAAGHCKWGSPLGVDFVGSFIHQSAAPQHPPGALLPFPSSSLSNPLPLFPYPSPQSLGRLYFHTPIFSFPVGAPRFPRLTSLGMTELVNSPASALGLLSLRGACSELNPIGMYSSFSPLYRCKGNAPTSGPVAFHSDLDRPAIRGFSVLSHDSAGSCSCLAACISFFYTARTSRFTRERTRFDNLPHFVSPRALLPQWVHSSLGSCIDTCDTKLPRTDQSSR